MYHIHTDFGKHLFVGSHELMPDAPSPTPRVLHNCASFLCLPPFHTCGPFFLNKENIDKKILARSRASAASYAMLPGGQDEIVPAAAG